MLPTCSAWKLGSSPLDGPRGQITIFFIMPPNALDLALQCMCNESNAKIVQVSEMKLVRNFNIRKAVKVRCRLGHVSMSGQCVSSWFLCFYYIQLVCFHFGVAFRGRSRGGGGVQGVRTPPFCRHVIERDHQQIRSIHAGCLNNLLNFELNFYLKMH